MSGADRTRGMRFFLPLMFTLLGVSAQATCTPAQQQQSAQAAARSAAQSQLGRAAFVYQLMYSHVTYDVKVAQAVIKGDTASVLGTVTLRGTERRTGKAAQGSYPGTVFLKRSGECGWKVTGYKRS